MNNLHQGVNLKTNLQTGVFVTAQLKHSLAMLQMPLQELSQEIANILETNPILETDDARDEDYDFDEHSENEDSTDKEPDTILENVTSDDWQEYIGYEKGDDISYRPMSSDDDNIDIDQFVSSRTSLYEHLTFQLKILEITAKQRKIGDYIIASLSDDGYFRGNIKDIADEFGVSEEDVLDILDMVKGFEPSGIASESLQECIVSQIKSSGCEDVYIDLSEELLYNYSTELADYRYVDIMKKMSIEKDTFDYIMSLIKKTDPKPGLNFSTDNINFIAPDVFIVKNEDKFDIILNESGLPAVRLNNRYIEMLKNPNLDAKSKEYIKDKVKNAVWVIESLQKRQKAIYKVAKVIVDYQDEFLRHGIEKLKPLRIKDVAEITELHDSTISRVTSGKFAMTTHGMIELKAFFAKSTDSDAGELSVNALKVRIKDLIEAEDSENPLSDQMIVDILSEKGIKIARRTIAKYRDELNFPTMSQRKRLRR